MSQLNNFNSVYPLITDLYGIDADTDSFENVALVAWEKIGNKHTRLYRYIGDTEECILKLPCNVCFIESVHIPITEAQITSNKLDFVNTDAIFVENYIDVWKANIDPFDGGGKYVKYQEGDNVLYFTRDYHGVKVVYHGILVDDEEGLPLISEKEAYAIAAFVA